LSAANIQTYSDGCSDTYFAPDMMDWLNPIYAIPGDLVQVINIRREEICNNTGKSI
jgi:hypothetical protein